jgi:hypothetical protein
MQFWASSETYGTTGETSEVIRRPLEQRINEELNRSDLKDLAIKYRYVPIIMPLELLEKYKARSRVSKKNRICDCAPQLDYDLFIDQPFEISLAEYVRGIETAIPSLAKLGLTSEQIALFSDIIKASQQAVLEDYRQGRVPTHRVQ